MNDGFKNETKEMIQQLKYFEDQVQEELIPRWIKARLNGLVKQFEELLK